MTFWWVCEGDKLYLWRPEGKNCWVAGLKDSQPGQRKEGFLRGKVLSLTSLCVCVGRWWFVVTVRMVTYRVFTVEGGCCEMWDCEMDLCLCAVHFLCYFGWWLYVYLYEPKNEAEMWWMKQQRSLRSCQNWVFMFEISWPQKVCRGNP